MIVKSDQLATMCLLHSSVGERHHENIKQAFKIQLCKARSGSSCKCNPPLVTCWSKINWTLFFSLTKDIHTICVQVTDVTLFELFFTLTSTPQARNLTIKGVLRDLSHTGRLAVRLHRLTEYGISSLASMRVAQTIPGASHLCLRCGYRGRTPPRAHARQLCLRFFGRGDGGTFHSHRIGDGSIWTDSIAGILCNVG